MSFAFLPLYTGDYLRDTADLSPREHGAYLLMLMWCWQRAKPMPNDMQRLYRLARAKDEHDEAAVRHVLSEFFYLGEDGCFHNRRLEAELERSNGLSKRGKIGAEARWAKVNGHAKPMLNECQTDAKRMDPTPTTIPTPIPITTKVKNTVGLKPDAARQILEFLNAKTGRSYRAVKANLQLIEARLAEGFSADDIRSVIAMKVEQWKGDDRMREFLRPVTLFGRTNFAQYQGQLARED